MKVVLDTNIFLSGIMLPSSIPGAIITAWRNAAFDLVLSEPKLSELSRVLAYPKIQKRIHWTPQDITRFIRLLRFRADIIDIQGVDVSVPRDPDDVPVLAALVLSGADWLVTGDQDLLVLRNKYSIETAAEFHRRL